MANITPKAQHYADSVRYCANSAIYYAEMTQDEALMRFLSGQAWNAEQAIERVKMHVNQVQDYANWARAYARMAREEGWPV